MRNYAFASFFTLLSVQWVLAHPSVLSKEIIDLTHPFGNNLTLTWPTNSAYNFQMGPRGFNEAIGSWYESNDFSQAEHSGTHTDAPSHFAQGKWRLGDIPVEKLIGPGIVIDISGKAMSNKDAQLSLEDVQKWEEKFGKIPTGAILIMYSGTGKLYANKTAYFGYPEERMQDPKDVKNLHFPGIAPETADWLVQNRQIHGTGVDTASVDFGQSRDFKTHQIFAAQNIWGLENLNNVDKLPPLGFTVYNMAYFGSEGSGGPSRVIAVIESVTSAGSKQFTRAALFGTLMIFLQIF